MKLCDRYFAVIGVIAFLLLCLVPSGQILVR